MLVGVLALQGDFEAHGKVLRGLGADVREVRVPADLDGLDGLIIPGGESTTMTLGIEREGLAEPLREFAQSGAPVFGTCAGMIMLDRSHLGVLDIECRRNAFGRQIRSFEADLRIPGVSRSARARGVHPRAVGGSLRRGRRGPRRSRRSSGGRAAGQRAGDLVPPRARGGDAPARALPHQRTFSRYWIPAFAVLNSASGSSGCDSHGMSCSMK